MPPWDGCPGLRGFAWGTVELGAPLAACHLVKSRGIHRFATSAPTLPRNPDEAAAPPSRSAPGIVPCEGYSNSRVTHPKP